VGKAGDGALCVAARKGSCREAVGIVLFI
jgi:hypothetical protein